MNLTAILRRRPKRPAAPAERWAWLRFHGIDNEGPYVHEMCAFCFGAGTGCQACDGRGYLVVRFTEEENAEIFASHAQLGIESVRPDEPLQTFGHLPG